MNRLSRVIIKGDFAPNSAVDSFIYPQHMLHAVTFKRIGDDKNH
jgi:hypothetical protein